MPLLSCKNLSAGYGDKKVVSNFSLDLDEGGYVCVVGANGVGKTTLMRTILGLQKPLAGEVVFGCGLRRRDIGYLAQASDIQKDFPASAFEVVLSGAVSGLGWRPFFSRAEKKEALSALEKVGAEDLKGQSFRELSGGQQRRVLLARALCRAKRALFLDEPDSALDCSAKEEMYSVLRQMNLAGAAILMISHDEAAASHGAKEIVKIGRLGAR